ncbi:MAG: (2Fe-2S)-binding protein [Syntrophorhabdus sp.]|jgi:carbon-monoxide dehydrogenase small subunit|nr:(2Fe-2S)-binding protein [Syntrophorhabdus sp.]HOD76280.1 (2Fe-2S)-binding protein [Syntrophorhabdaceae bacterium]
MKKLITLTVNDTEYEVAVAPNKTLTQVLREDLNLLGTKEGCGVGDCGACTVVLDGKPVNSCLVLAVQADGSRIKTIEGVAHGDSLHPVQETFVELGAIQCGFCTPGMILSATSLLEKNPHPTEQEVRQALSGNLCRCTGYQKIVEAVQEASRRMKG